MIHYWFPQQEGGDVFVVKNNLFHFRLFCGELQLGSWEQITWKKINKRVKYRKSLGEPLNLTGPTKKEWTKRQVFPASWSSEAELIFPHWGFRLGLYNNLWDNANRLLFIFLWEENSLEEKMTWLKINVWWSVYHLECNMFSMDIYVGCIHLNSRLHYWLRNRCDMDIIASGTEQND